MERGELLISTETGGSDKEQTYMEAIFEKTKFGVAP